jgi:hypothetical protein
MNRIRYAKTEKPGILISVKTYQIEGGKEVRVELDTNVHNYKIFDALTNEAIIQGGDDTAAKNKRWAKKALEHLGVAFEKEERPRDVENQ